MSNGRRVWIKVKDDQGKTRQMDLGEEVGNAVFDV